MSIVASLAFAGAVAACSQPEGGQPGANPGAGTVAPIAQLAADGPSVTPLELPDGFVQEDTRAVALPKVVANEYDQPPLPVYGGDAQMTGTVFGPDGPVDGARVRIERFVGARGGYAEVTTNKEGFYGVYGILGGHYRVRAWLKPDLATAEPQTTFVRFDAKSVIDVGVNRFDKERFQAALTVGDPRVTQFSLMRVLLVKEEVDEKEGVVKGKGIPDIEISAAPQENENWEVISDPIRTNGDGAVDLVIVCRATGKWPMLVATPSQIISIEMPECVPNQQEAVPETTTTTESTTTTTDPSASSTSSTSPSSTSSSSTTTTQPGNPIDLKVGQAFEVPFAGPIPGGAYTMINKPPETGPACATELDIFARDRWIRGRVIGPVINLPYTMRNFVAINDVRACTFRREG